MIDPDPTRVHLAGDTPLAHPAEDTPLSRASPSEAQADAVLSRRAAGRIVAVMFALLAGVGNLPAVVLPMYPAADRPRIALLGATFIAIGAVIWFLPWQRWSRRASLWLVPLAFALVDIFNLVVPINPYRYAIYLIAVFAWIGMAHGRGVSVAFLPLLIPVYLLPLQAQGLLTLQSGLAIIYVALFCVLMGETLAWFATRLGKNQQALQASEERYRRIVETAQEGIFALSSDACVTYVNQRMATMLGYTAEEMAGQSLYDFMDAEHAAATRPEFDQRRLRMAEARTFDACFRRKDGQAVWMLASTVALTDGSGAFAGEFAMVTDITERKRAEEELRHQALHDALTELPNRTLLGDRIEQGILLARRDRRPLALLLLDLDRFKEVNDTFGHPHGDAVLHQVARRLRDHVRATDTVARLGGDEFALLLPGYAAADASAAALIVRECLEPPVTVEGHTMYLSASVGIAVYPDHGHDAPTLLRRADVAMYVAKHRGLGVAVYEPGEDRFSRERIALMAALREAIEDDRLVLHYQPIMDVSSRTVSRVEALARWPHPERGLIQPDAFIALAEESGLMGALTRSVLRLALRQCREWRCTGRHLKIGVNLSMSNLAEPDLMETVLELLRAHDVPPDCLRVELTESAVMSEHAHGLRVLRALAAAGVHISVDDFGTGYSSLAYLTRLPVDELKIDKSFVLHLADGEAGAVIVRSIVAMAHALGLRVVAEGVETQDALELLGRLSCDAVQGYYLSRPLPAQELERWLAGVPGHAA